MAGLTHTDRGGSRGPHAPSIREYLEENAVYAIITVVAFILILGILVMIHELGHFLTARLFGVRVEEFGLGFPPRVYPSPQKAKRIRESGRTVYSLNALPLGGFVRLAGENGVAAPRPEAVEDAAEGQATRAAAGLSLSGQSAPADDPGAFANKPAWQRIIILVAGAFNNMVLAMLLVFILLAVIGTPRTMVQVAGVEFGSPAYRAGLRSGDIIQRAAGQPIQDTSDVRKVVTPYLGRPVDLAIKRGNRAFAVNLVPRVGPLACDTGPIGVVTSPSNAHNVPVDAGQAAATALNVPVAVAQALAAIPGALINPPAASSPAPRGPNCPFATRYVTFGGHVTDALTIQNHVQVPGAVQNDTCLPASSSGVAVTGPIGILRQVGCEANAISTRGWEPLLTLIIDLSATLAVMNLLPFPALDGGRVLFVLISLVARRRVRPETEALAHALGMAALLTLIFVISAHDISNWFTNRPTF